MRTVTHLNSLTGTRCSVTGPIPRSFKKHTVGLFSEFHMALAFIGFAPGRKWRVRFN